MCRRGQRRLWCFTREQLQSAFRAELNRLGMNNIVSSLYGLRHGGASHDSLFQLRESLDVKLRGRWSSDKSMLRYRKAALSQKEASKLAPELNVLATTIFDDPAHFFDELGDARALLSPVRRT